MLRPELLFPSLRPAGAPPRTGPAVVRATRLVGAPTGGAAPLRATGPYGADGVPDGGGGGVCGVVEVGGPPPAVVTSPSAGGAVPPGSRNQPTRTRRRPRRLLLRSRLSPPPSPSPPLPPTLSSPHRAHPNFVPPSLPSLSPQWGRGSVREGRDEGRDKAPIRGPAGSLVTAPSP